MYAVNDSPTSKTTSKHESEDGGGENGRGLYESGCTELYGS
jgi:hypothetical protein